ncbi:unnamed protein product [Rotaria socialis]|uniref:Alkaline ceramidase n=1 Tax=Rotaria socialis TaxID=392032 RepID=A0A818BKA7_9BILA|nr:unnamed protein product [Rotaria socialis]CAF3418917.1 unnamed protein product [Rotaria socialis]CAF3505867.1 unnamed protein product [Rotaria socialis]CAF3738254.1 unnamed protein product [Rotaria socialis]CAF3753249.1 unnamed protein product [Rotaria socialis]
MLLSILIIQILANIVFRTIVIEARTVLSEYTHRPDVKHFESELDRTTGYWSPSTSSIDWCERNYVVTQYIAEFWNCLSSLVFCLLSGILFFQALYYRIENRFLLLCLSYMFVGLGSAFFHGTLTYLGQMADELSMVYSMIIWWFILFRMDKFNKIRNKMYRLDLGIVFAIFYGILWTYMHSLKTFIVIFQVHFGLMVFGAILKSIFIYRQTQHRTRYIMCLIIIYVTLLIPALTSWILDQELCERMNTTGGFNPQLHAWWHVFCAIDSHVGLVCTEAMRLLSIKYNLHKIKHADSSTESFKPEDHLHIRFYFGLPYVDYSHTIQLKQQ